MIFIFAKIIEELYKNYTISWGAIAFISVMKESILVVETLYTSWNLFIITSLSEAKIFGAEAVNYFRLYFFNLLYRLVR